MARAKTWPGYSAALGKGSPWNLVDIGGINLVPVDMGSELGGVAAPLSAAELANLQDEDDASSTVVASARLAGGPLDIKSLIDVEIRPDGLQHLYGGIAQFASGLGPYRHATRGPWHLVPRIKTFYGFGVSDPTLVTLTEDAGMMNEDCTTAVATEAETGYIAYAVQVGYRVGSRTYSPPVDSIFIWGGTQPPGALVPMPYGSNDGVNWTALLKSTSATGGWVNGAYHTTAGDPFGGSGWGVLLGATHTDYAYYMIVYNNTAGSSQQIAEIAALSKYGQVETTDDWDYYSGLSVDNPALGVASPRYVFGDTLGLATAFRWRFRPFVLATIAADRTLGDVALAHLELYNDPLQVDCADADGNLTDQLTDSAEPGEEGVWKLAHFVNATNANSSSAQAWVPLNPQQITADASFGVTYEGLTSGFLRDANRNIAQCRYILNEDGTSLGDITDTSVSWDGGMGLGWVEVAIAPVPGLAEYLIDYETGAVTTGLPIPVDSAATFKMAHEGAQVLELSENGADGIVTCGGTLTMANGVVPAGGTLAFYHRQNLTNFTQRKNRRADIYQRLGWG